MRFETLLMPVSKSCIHPAIGWSIRMPNSHFESCLRFLERHCFGHGPWPSRRKCRDGIEHLVQEGKICPLFEAVNEAERGREALSRLQHHERIFQSFEHDRDEGKLVEHEIATIHMRDGGFKHLPATQEQRIAAQHKACSAGADRAPEGRKLFLQHYSREPKTF